MIRRDCEKMKEMKISLIAAVIPKYFEECLLGVEPLRSKETKDYNNVDRDIDLRNYLN